MKLQVSPWVDIILSPSTVTVSFCHKGSEMGCVWVRLAVNRNQKAGIMAGPRGRRKQTSSSWLINSKLRPLGARETDSEVIYDKFDSSWRQFLIGCDKDGIHSCLVYWTRPKQDWADEDLTPALPFGPAIKSIELRQQTSGQMEAWLLQRKWRC